MPSNQEFHTFRDSRRRTSTLELAGAVRKTLDSLAATASLDAVLSLLLQAGELECALSDAAAPPEICERAARLTDLFAAAAVARDISDSFDSVQIVRQARSILEVLHYSGPLSVSVPEGFAYYALHPLDYADLVTRSQVDATPVMVVGIRSIGTTLSAVAAAKLRAEAGCPGSRDFRDPGERWSMPGENRVSRLSVRPIGHPYDRQCELNPAQRADVASALASNATFLICDEGPGRSGSSLLSVAEALEREGVPRARILILCAHAPNVAALCARDAEERWPRYRVIGAGMTSRLPADAAQYLGSGKWRKKFFITDESEPAAWPQMERLRYGSSDGRTLFTFEGHGPYGAAVRRRQQALSEAGFGLPYLGQDAGFGRQDLVKGRAARSSDVCSELLTHMAEYCAWRAREFAVSEANPSQLENMARVNRERGLGIAKDDLTLPVERPTICDARMMPHDWLQTDGRWLKLNAAIHGDDHFFPGPCDIAWDLAGVIVEWDLSGAARQYFLSEYRRDSGDDPSQRIAAYELAYATFRMAWSGMAAGSVMGTEEETPLMRDYERYRAFLSSEASTRAPHEEHAFTVSRETY